MLLVALIRSAPWLILLLILGAIALFVRRRFWPKPTTDAAPEPAAAG